MLDLVIRDGLVFDGSGRPPRREDVGIRDGRIVALAPKIDADTAEVCDAGGLWVMPGFVDIHTHYDIEVEVAPGLAESVRHGVTSVVMGNCSLSLTLGDAADLAAMFLRVETIPAALVQRWIAAADSWPDAAAYVAHLEALPKGPNVAAMLGHSALRAAVMGLERSVSAHATDDELVRMRRLAHEALEAGCLGISVDMVPWHMMSGTYHGRTIPSQHADGREYAMLAEVCRAHDAVLQVTPNPQDPRSFATILRLSLGLTRRPLRVTVLTAIDSVAHRQMWRLFPWIGRLVNGILGGNLRFQTLTEPFTVVSHGPITPLFEEFPAGIRLNDAADADGRRALWRDPRFCQEFRRDWGQRRGRTFHRDFGAMRVAACPEAAHVGATIAAIAGRERRDALSVFMDLLATHDRDLVWIATGGNDRALQRRRLLADPSILPGFTDAGAHVQHLAFYDGALTLLREARTSKFMTIERAVQRVTSEPARWFRLDAGEIRCGARADVVLLRPETLGVAELEPVTVADPLLDGALRLVNRGQERTVAAVYVAGRRVVRDGEPLPMLGNEPCGVVLRRPAAAAVAVAPRDRIGVHVGAHPFTDYWDVFVMKHRRPANVACHVAGLCVLPLVLAFYLAHHDWRWLLALPLSQVIGLVGHGLFERTHVDRQDAVFSLRASACLARMFGQVFRGRYGREVVRVEAALTRFQKSQSL